MRIASFNLQRLRLRDGRLSGARDGDISGAGLRQKVEDRRSLFDAPWHGVYASCAALDGITFQNRALSFGSRCSAGDHAFQPPGGEVMSRRN